MGFNVIVKEAFDWIWDKVPWWLKWPVVIILTPTTLVISFISWHTSTIHATIRPYEEKRDAQMAYLQESQKEHLEFIKDKIHKIEQTEGKILDELIRRRR